MLAHFTQLLIKKDLIIKDGLPKELIIKNMSKQKGFITSDNYAAVPWGKRFVIIYNGEQLTDVKTILQAQKFIKQHRATPKTGTVFV